MNINYDPKEQNKAIQARESFNGRLLTDSQFDEAMTITNIIEREIRKTGAFKEKLGDYSYAFSRSEKFDAMKSEAIIRDLFKERCGQTMNQMKEGLKINERNLTSDQKHEALSHAQGVGKMIQDGNKISFHRAYAYQGQNLADKHNITETHAKSLMREAFKASDGKELYDWGKEQEKQFYTPQIEAEKQQRQNTQSQSHSPHRSR